MTHKLVVIDDEHWIRKGIIQLIPWEELGFTLAGEAADGESACALVDSVNPDVALLDMRMPGLDGKELIRYFSSKFPNMIVIIISGYSDFEYTREAIRFQVFDYLLKPVKETELRSLLEKARFILNQKEAESSRHRLQPLADASASEGIQIVSSIVQMIKNEYDKSWTLHGIARQRHMHPDYLSRLFKKETGKNFVDYLTDHRIERAKALIVTSDLKNYEIADHVGYDDYRYFSQVFKKKTGMTIGEYRRKFV